MKSFMAMASVCVGSVVCAAEFPQIYNSQQETIPFTKAEDALKGIRLPEGFRATLFAAEPDVQQPIGFTTDARGRIWVGENFTYAERALNFDTKLRDRIVIFEDADGDGRAEKRTVFWDQAVKLTSVLPDSEALLRYVRRNFCLFRMP